MRKVVVGAMMSMDGVMQAPGGPDEDPSHGFSFGGWVASIGEDPQFGEELGKLFSGPYELLLGRRTYEIFAAYWPFYDENASDGGIAQAFNQARKYVASRNGVDLTWNNSVALRDAVRDVAKLKQEDGPVLLTQGSTELVQALLAAGLVDELRIFTFPLMLGSGKRLFNDAGQPRTFKLAHGAVSPKGIVATTYVRAGEVRTATVGGDFVPSPAELARREKWKRE